MDIPKKAGLYIVTLKNHEPISVNANDKRIADKAIKVTKANCKFGKSDDLARRKNNYDKVFGQHNVIYTPLVVMDEIDVAEKAVLQMLDRYRIRGKTNRKNEWLENICSTEVVRIVFETLDSGSHTYAEIDNRGNF